MKTKEEWVLFVFRCYDFAQMFDGNYMDNNICIFTSKTFYYLTNGSGWSYPVTAKDLDGVSSDNEPAVKTEIKITIHPGLNSIEWIEAFLDLDTGEIISSSGFDSVDGSQLLLHLEKISSENTIKLKKILKLNK